MIISLHRSNVVPLLHLVPVDVLDVCVASIATDHFTTLKFQLSPRFNRDFPDVEVIQKGYEYYAVVEHDTAKRLIEFLGFPYSLRLVDEGLMAVELVDYLTEFHDLSVDDYVILEDDLAATKRRSRDWPDDEQSTLTLFFKEDALVTLVALDLYEHLAKVAVNQ